MFFLLAMRGALSLTGSNVLQEQTIPRVLSNGVLTINHKSHIRNVQHKGDLCISQSKVDALDSMGELSIAQSKIDTLKSSGHAKIQQSKIKSITYTGDLTILDSKMETITISGFAHFEKCKVSSVTYRGTRIVIKDSEIDTVTIENDHDQPIDVIIYHCSHVKKLIMRSKNIRLMKDDGSKIDEKIFSL